MKKFIFILSFIILTTINANAQYADSQYVTEFQTAKGRTFYFDKPMTMEEITSPRTLGLMNAYERADEKVNSGKAMFWISTCVQVGGLLTGFIAGQNAVEHVYTRDYSYSRTDGAAVAVSIIGYGLASAASVTACIGIWKWVIGSHDRNYATLNLYYNGISVQF